MARFSKKNTLPKRSTAHIGAQKKHIFGGDDFSRKTFQKRKKKTVVTEIKKQYTALRKQDFPKRYVLFALFILVGCVLLFVLLGPLFRVQEIFITRQGTVININQAYDSVDTIRGKNVFFLEPKDIITRLERTQNTIKNITIDVSLPNTLNISLQSYSPLFYTGDYVILENGVIIPRENLDITTLTPLIISKNVADMYVYGEKFNQEDLKKITYLQQNITKNIIGFTPKTFLYFPVEKEIILRGNLDSFFIFDLTGNLDAQIKQLSIYHKEYSNITQNPVIYIDARVSEKLFICGYDAEFDCWNNLKYIYGEKVFSELLAPDTSETQPSVIPQENPENTVGLQDQQ